MDLMEKIVALAKRRGFIFQGSEIYGGLGGTWDYGPTGSLLKKNFKDLWWKEMVQLRDDVVGVDAAIMMNPRAWEASGHVEAFTDPLVECKICHKRFREDKVQALDEKFREAASRGVTMIAPFSPEESDMYFCKKNKNGNKRHEFTESRKFNLLVEAKLGVIEGEEQTIYLRGEITNGVHVNFRNVVDSTRIKIPFGIAQVGKAFRNEITPGNFTFRSREFEQMEVQFYIKPVEAEGKKWFEYWKQNRMEWYLSLGMKKENLRFRDHKDDERAHYAKMATDIEYKSPWGWGEMMGIHHRGDWDLRRHSEYSKQDLSYRDQTTNETYIPWDIETSAGVDRSILFLLLDAYQEEENRVFLKLDPRIAPYKAAIFPLLGNKPELIKKARSVYQNLKKQFVVTWDDRGNIGKRYASQDEIGTPYCITIDFQSLDDDMVTVRDRNTAKQVRIKISDIEEFLNKKINS